MAQAPTQAAAQAQAAVPVQSIVFVQGAVRVVDAPAPTQDELITQVLMWIRFSDQASRDNLKNDSLGSLEEIASLTEKDITNFHADWAARTIPNGKFHIRARHTKRLQAFMHWVQDFKRVAEPPTIIGLNEDDFDSQLTRALSRALIRKNLKDQT